MGLNFGSISSLASIVNMFAGSSPVKAQLIPLDGEGREVEADQRAFQYFPENISDSKGANYASRNIPGGSHPIYQFINGTDRTLSFTAIFTSDEDPSPPGLLDALQGALDIGLGDVTSALGITSGGNQKKHTTSVDSAVVWLRSFLYPRYSNAGTNGSPLGTVAPPPVLRLYLPNSNIYGSTASGALTLDAVDVLMTQCDVTYDAFYRNGSQRITTVNLTFNETIQTGATNWKFADGQVMIDAWKNGKSAKMKKYLIQGKTKPKTADDVVGNVSSALGAVSSVASKLGF